MNNSDASKSTPSIGEEVSVDRGISRREKAAALLYAAALAGLPSVIDWVSGSIVAALSIMVGCFVLSRRPNIRKGELPTIALYGFLVYCVPAAVNNLLPDAKCAEILSMMFAGTALVLLADAAYESVAKRTAKPWVFCGKALIVSAFAAWIGVSRLNLSALALFILVAVISLGSIAYSGRHRKRELRRDS